MAYPKRSEPHQIDIDAVLDYLRQENWMTFASSTREPKQLDLLVNGSTFRVLVRGTETYRGQNVSNAVRAYNEAR